MRGKLLIIVFLISFCGHAQKSKEVKNLNVSNFKVLRLGQTKPLSELVRIPSTDRNKKAKVKAKVTAAPQNFIGRNGSNAIIPELEHQGIDPIRQKVGAFGGRVAVITPTINMDGLASSFGSPNDPSGDVGLNYYVQAINATDIAVYDKTDGTLVDQFTGNALWSAINESSAGDPIILFDHEYNRWIITEFTSPSGSANLLFAISATSDPLGSYNVYSFSPPNFPDYPKWAIWNDTYMVTTNEQGPGALHQYFFDRAGFIAGDTEVSAQRVEITGNSNTEAGFYVTTPVSWIGDVAPADSNPIAVKINDSSWGEVANDAIEVLTFDVDFENETTVTKTTIETTPFDGYPCDNVDPTDFSCLTQGGSSQGIDGIPELIMNLPHYRNFETHESIVLSFITDVDDGNNLAGIRWVELRRTTADWELYQEGTYAPDDGLHRFMPSISMDKDGNIGLAYNTTSSSEFVGIKFTGRYAEDPLGMMTVTEFNVVDGGASVGGDRFGDYAQMSIDPQNERTFWYTSEYAASGGSKTRIVAFELESNTNDLTVNAILNPNTSTSLSATETVTAVVKNIGSAEAINFDLILKLDGVAQETYTHSETLASGEELSHDFGTTLDLSALGDYVVTVEVDLADDELPGNNSLDKAITNLPGNDAAVELSATSSTCTNSVSLDVEIENGGGILLESVDIEVYLNSAFVETINWTGSITTGRSDTEQVLVENLISGNNDISIILSNPNGATDEVSSNNESALSVNFDTSLDQVTFTLNTDQYPNETTWELLDSESQVIASGGPYILEEATITELICVEPDGCYEFIIYDAFDDGICCDYGSGSYSISDSNENLIFSSNGQFGESESTSFCIGTECNLTVSVDVVDATADLPGALFITASGSYGYRYSINSGANLTSTPVFNGLQGGIYDVYVESQDGNCIYEESVTVGPILGTSVEETVTIAPNPTKGVFKISVPGHDYIKGFLQVEVIDLNGKIIQNHRFTRYDDSFEGTISLYAYPNGIYFLKLVNAESNRLVKVIKQ